MRKHVLDFLHRGVAACWLGSMVLAVLYLILQKKTGVQTLTVNQMCTGIFSLTALAFVAGGMNAIYQIERLPVMAAVLIHGGVLYVGYLGTYLLNGWLESGTAPILVFSGIFVMGYLAIWAVIYWIVKQRTDRVNELLKKKQQSAEAEENG